MNTAVRNLRQARDLIDLHLPIVVGAALKLAMVDFQALDDEQARRRSVMSVYHWNLHSNRVKRLAVTLRAILPPE